ncbi:MAG: LysR family transcriptional regulator [Burkholderiales bacterium]|nr:LysR family transcriptional regulator [Burkholderiales bacterium]
MNNFNGIAEFVAAVELRSFALAAQHVGMTPSGVSKAVRRLEQRLGTRLLTRTTRRLTLTPSGILFYQRCRQLLVGLRDAESIVAHEIGLPRGTLRVDISLPLGRRYIVPALPLFMAENPDVLVQLVFREPSADLFHEGVDIAVRIGHVKGANLAAQKIGAVRQLTCASTQYLEAHGTPTRPEHLLQHNCLAFLSMHTGQARDWHFAEGRSAFTLAVNGNLALSNTDALVEAAAMGLGITQVSDYAAASAVESGRLAPILTDWVPSARPIMVLYRDDREPPAKILAFTKFLLRIMPGARRE